MGLLDLWGISDDEVKEKAESLGMTPEEFVRRFRAHNHVPEMSEKYRLKTEEFGKEKKRKVIAEEVDVPKKEKFFEGLVPAKRSFTQKEWEQEMAIRKYNMRSWQMTVQNDIKIGKSEEV